ncbi:muconate cycloisomerase [Candidimonas sp. SYP-B2681]|uniref:muconate/chloromuconate family cycloisomerase n=1 Tax=Candidimonas sp. SYP-B2681 TaxID=2497686 RepID=UPI000F86793B|nr:muconate/chloromuconate family cycloisomerase [Candidimonas sp. SYP-B2681]RTZ47598.1 muconate cycloisomerase [Candidimonas sp. SYP-B2681]
MQPTIVDVTTHILDIPTIRPHKMSVATMQNQTIVLVRIKTSDGIEGIGEATTIGGLNYGGESPESIKTNIDAYFAPLIMGQPGDNPAALRVRIDKAIKANHFAKSAIETAIYDGCAKRLGVPLSTLFGGAVHEEISVAWTLASGDTDKDIAEALQMLEARRHNIFKLKVGMRPLKDDLRHIAAIKAAVGDEISVRIDVNQGWSETQALQMLRPLADIGVELVEQPIHEKNLPGMARLTGLGILPIMADEALKGREDGFALASNKCADVFAIKIEQAGGLQGARDLIGIAQAADIALYGGTMLEGSISTVAAAHLFATVNKLEWGTEMFGPLLLQDDILVERLDYRDFALKLPKGPGLGITLDEEKVRRYTRK